LSRVPNGRAPPRAITGCAADAKESDVVGEHADPGYDLLEIVVALRDLQIFEANLQFAATRRGTGQDLVGRGSGL